MDKLRPASDITVRPVGQWEGDNLIVGETALLPNQLYFMEIIHNDDVTVSVTLDADAPTLDNTSTNYHEIFNLAGQLFDFTATKGHAHLLFKTSDKPGETTFAFSDATKIETVRIFQYGLTTRSIYAGTDTILHLITGNVNDCINNENYVHPGSNVYIPEGNTFDAGVEILAVETLSTCAVSKTNNYTYEATVQNSTVYDFEFDADDDNYENCVPSALGGIISAVYATGKNRHNRYRIFTTNTSLVISFSNTSIDLRNVKLWKVDDSSAEECTIGA